VTGYSLPGYRFLVGLSELGYGFTSFDDFAPSDRIVALRHDIDQYPEAPVAMAELEHELGVTSTYSLRRRSLLCQLRDAEFTG
jgi:hypothetical protein